MLIKNQAGWKKVLMVFSLIILLIATGCAQKNTTTDKNDNESPKTGPLKITLSGYSVGGAASAIGQAIGEAINRSYPGSVFSYEPGQSGANEIKVSKGETELGLSSSLLVDAATKGQEPYTGKTLSNLRAIAFLHSNDMTFIVDKKSGIKSIEEFKTKPVRIAVNTKNSFMELTSRAVLKSYGITYEDIEKRGGKVYFTNANTSLDQMRNRQVDVIAMNGPTPTSAYIDAATTLDLDILPMSKEAIEKTNQAIGTITVTVPKGSYPFQNEDIVTVGIDNIVIASTDLKDDVAYAVAKALTENLDYLYSASKTLKQMTKATITKVGRDIPLHPGAEKYYREIGIVK